jgi:hypothetical protein
MKEDYHKLQNGLEIAKASAIGYDQPHIKMHEKKVSCSIGMQQRSAFFPNTSKANEAGEIIQMNGDSELQTTIAHSQMEAMTSERKDDGYRKGQFDASFDAPSETPNCRRYGWAPWIVFSKHNGLEVCKQAREVMVALPTPVCIVLFYGNTESRLSRTEILVRTLFPSSIPENTCHEGSLAEEMDVLGQASNGHKEKEEEKHVVVRLWRKVVRVKASDNKRVSVVIAEASPVPGLDEGLALALSSLICSHMVYCGQGVLDEPRILELKSLHKLTKHVRARNDVGESDDSTSMGEEEDGLSFNTYFPRLTWLFQDFQVYILSLFKFPCVSRYIQVDGHDPLSRLWVICYHITAVIIFVFMVLN